MNPEPVVSIIIPSLNQGKYIKESIDAVLNQTYPKVECIVVDGGSTDNTVEILETYGKRIEWTSGKDKGQSSAINKGFRMCHGEICTWIGSDDILLPHTVELVASAFQRDEGVGLVYGNIEYIDAEGTLTRSVAGETLSLDALLNQDQSVNQPGSFYRTDLVSEIGFLDMNLQYVMDYDLFIRLLEVSKAERISETLARFRLWGENKSDGRGRLMSSLEAFRVGRRHGARLLTILNLNRARNILRYFVTASIGRQAYFSTRHS